MRRSRKVRVFLRVVFLLTLAFWAAALLGPSVFYTYRHGREISLEQFMRDELVGEWAEALGDLRRAIAIARDERTPDRRRD